MQVDNIRHLIRKHVWGSFTFLAYKVKRITLLYFIFGKVFFYINIFTFLSVLTYLFMFLRIFRPIRNVHFNLF